MQAEKKVQTALISVFYKDGLEPLVKQLDELGVEIYSTGGTQSFIEGLGIKVNRVEDLTSYPSILGGRVKTLHPKVFGGILARRELQEDVAQLEEYEIPPMDLVVVDLYPFEETVKSGGSESEIIEKIDIGGISLIRAAAKNFKEVITISNRSQYAEVTDFLKSQNGSSSLEQRKKLAKEAFKVSSGYDTAIAAYFAGEESCPLLIREEEQKALRYGENPHQAGIFYGELDKMFDKLHGKELSYNNLLDVDAAVQLMSDFKEEKPTFAILKHNNACGLASRDTILEAYKDALAGDPVSAFGGILIANRKIDQTTAEEVNKLFCEVVIAPEFDAAALEILKQKKNRIILKQKEVETVSFQVRTALNGYLYQEKDRAIELAANYEQKTKVKATQEQLKDLEFALKLVKHTKSNSIVLAKGQQLLASGTGQTSRVDALQQAIAKAKHFDFELEGAVMASDAFFPFPDCVEIADKAGVKAVVQPGGSVKDQLSIDYCDEHGMAMVFTGVRHFKH
jgi:phosphoribosylaminoimidazolecarboxamide formyltransferase/IMP cyclohydrolase